MAGPSCYHLNVWRDEISIPGMENREIVMERKKFEGLVSQAIDELPDRFRQRLENLAIVVEDEPAPEIQEDYSDRLLLGLYRGAPLTNRTVWSRYPFPDMLSNYQRNIETICRK